MDDTFLASDQQRFTLAKLRCPFFKSFTVRFQRADVASLLSSGKFIAT
jgi:hypothetical protein